MLDNLKLGYGGRSPHGERGLKYRLAAHLEKVCGRSPHGERGLKLLCIRPLRTRDTCRSPHGERGLKSHALAVGHGLVASLPARGAWIEMPQSCIRLRLASVAPRTGSVD